MRTGTDNINGTEMGMEMDKLKRTGMDKINRTGTDSAKKGTLPNTVYIYIC